MAQIRPSSGSRNNLRLTSSCGHWEKLARYGLACRRGRASALPLPQPRLRGLLLSCAYVRVICCSALPASALPPAQIRPRPHRHLPSFFLSLRRRRPSFGHISAADLALLTSMTSHAQLRLCSCVCLTFVRFMLSVWLLSRCWLAAGWC